MKVSIKLYLILYLASTSTSLQGWTERSESWQGGNTRTFRSNKKGAKFERTESRERNYFFWTDETKTDAAEQSFDDLLTFLSIESKKKKSFERWRWGESQRLRFLTRLSDDSDFSFFFGGSELSAVVSSSDWPETSKVALDRKAWGQERLICLMTQLGTVGWGSNERSSISYGWHHSRWLEPG